MTTNPSKLPYYLPLFSIPFLLTGCPLVDDPDKSDKAAEAEELCEDLAYWLCGHGERCLDDIPVDECTEAVIRDLHCRQAVGVNENYETCGREIVDWNCEEGDAPPSCRDAILYEGDEPSPSGDTDDTETSSDLDSDTDSATDNTYAKASCQYLYLTMCEQWALCIGEQMGDTSQYTAIRNECIQTANAEANCDDAVGVSDGYQDCISALEAVDCSDMESSAAECANVILY